MPLNPDQQRWLRKTLWQVDTLLSEAAEVFGERSGAKLFPMYLADASPAQRETIDQGISEIRSILRHHIRDLCPRTPGQPVSGLHAFRVSLSFALIALDECSPTALRGYGELGPEDAARVEQLLCELRACLERLSMNL